MSNIPAEVRKNLSTWKQEYGEVFYVPGIDGSGIVLKNFTLEDHEMYILESQIDEDAANENLVNKCVLWPETFNLDNLPTAALSVILNKLNAVSPYDNPERFFAKLDEKRALVNTPKGQMYAYIGAAFPSMKLKDIQRLHFDDVALHLALAEKILGHEFQISPAGELQAVPEQQMSPAQLQQYHRHKRLQEKRAAREAALQGKRLSQVHQEDRTPPPSPEPQEGRNPLIQDRDEMMDFLRGSGG